MRGQEQEEHGESKRATSDDDDADAAAAADEDGERVSVSGSRLMLNPCMSREVMRGPCTCQELLFTCRQSKKQRCMRLSLLG